MILHTLFTLYYSRNKRFLLKHFLNNQLHSSTYLQSKPTNVVLSVIDDRCLSDYQATQLWCKCARENSIFPHLILLDCLSSTKHKCKNNPLKKFQLSLSSFFLDLTISIKKLIYYRVNAQYCRLTN